MQLSDRMKEYEDVWDQRLPRRIPVIIRIDGNSFSKYTKQCDFKKPFDEQLMLAMSQTTKALLEYCSGAVLGYTQSDEISILLRNDQTIQTDPFLGNRIQKICSLLGSVAGVAFEEAIKYCKTIGIVPQNKYATFDCRVFTLPNEVEVNNYFLWRQQDAFKNCVSSYCYHSKIPGATKAVHGLSTSERQEWLFQNLDLNINDTPSWHRRGHCLRKMTYELPINKAGLSEKAIENLGNKTTVTRSFWEPDFNTPLFSEDTNYVNSGGLRQEPRAIIPT